MAYTFNTIVESPEKLERMLVGRKPIVELIHNKAIALVEENSLFQTLIIGPRGSGKTHLLRVFFNRIWEHPQRDEKIVIAYMVEDERGIDNFFDLVRRISEAILRRYNGTEAHTLNEGLEKLKTTSPDLWESSITDQLLTFLKDRNLIIIIENLNIVFDGIGIAGQSKLRDFIQQHGNISIVASSQSLFKDIQKEDKPFQNFFSIIKLNPLSFEEALALIKALAKEDKLKEFEDFLTTNKGQANVHAVYDLTQGNHRLLVTFYDFLKAEYKSDISEAFLQTIDRLKPYYESYFKLLSPQQQKIVQYLCSQRKPATGKEITLNCFIAQTTISKQMSELQKLGYVESNKVGKDAYYEITEPMLRLSFDINENSRGIVSIFIEFLTQLYEIEDIGKQYLKYKYLADFQDESLRSIYQKEAGFYHEALAKFGTLSLADYESDLLKLSTKEERQSFLDNLNIGDTGNVYTLFQEKAIELVKTGELDKAFKLVNDSLKKGDGNYFHHFVLGYIYQNQNMLDLAEVCYNRALELNPNDEITWYNLGILYDNKKQYNQAEEAYKKAIEIDPEDQIAWNNLGNLYQDNNQYNQAEKAYKKAIELDPEHQNAWNNLGNLYQDNKQYKQAEKAYKKAIELDPEYRNAWGNLGNLYQDNKQFKQAENAYKKVIEIEPEDEKAWYNLGNLYGINKQLNQAVNAYKKAIELDPEHQSTWNNLGNLYQDNKLFKQAEKAYKKVIEIDPEDEKAWYNLGNLYENNNQYMQAEKAYKKAIEIEPEYRDAWNNLGVLYDNNKQFKPAEKAYKKAIELSPQVQNTFYNISRLFMNDGQADKALQWINKGLKNISDDHELLSLKCNLLIEIGDQKRFLASLKQYLQSGHKEGFDIPFILQLILNELLKNASESFVRSLLQRGYPLFAQYGYEEAFQQSITGTIPYLLKNHETIELKRLKMIEMLFDEFLPTERIQYWKVFINVGIDYFYNKNKRALYQLSKEERNIFLKFIGEDDKKE